MNLPELFYLQILVILALEYDAKKAALGKSGPVEQLSVDNIYSSSNKPCPEPEDFLNELKISKQNSNGNTPPNEVVDEKLDRKQQKLKEQHLHQLGLRKNSRSDTNSEKSDVVAEDRNGPFRIPTAAANPTNRKANGKPQSQAQNHNNNNNNHQTRQKNSGNPQSHSLLLSDELQVRRKVTTNVAGVGAKEKLVCLCTQMSEFYSHNKTAKSLSCSAVDQIRSERVGCCNDVVGNQLNLQRPSSRVSFMVLCQSHKNRFHSHHCCPVCGIFCTEGQFQLCPRNHLFHKDCVQKTLGQSVGGRAGRHGISCPHCGVDVIEPEINLYMECSNELTYYPNHDGFM